VPQQFRAQLPFRGLDGNLLEERSGGMDCSLWKADVFLELDGDELGGSVHKLALFQWLSLDEVQSLGVLPGHRG
jgi:hypothetical protein